MKRPMHHSVIIQKMRAESRNSSGTGGRAAIRLRNRIEVEDTALNGQGDGVGAVSGS
jgi:hypothetical protein